MMKQVAWMGVASAVLAAGMFGALVAQTPAPSNFLSNGYLPRGQLPDRIASDPPPPVAGSPRDLRDHAAEKAALALRGSPRWDQAARDADLFGPGADGLYSCAAGFALGGPTMPQTHKLLLRVARDFGTATSPMKDKYQRPRPFMVNGQPSCTPDSEATLRHNGSYPSGHSAIGYGWGLVLAALVPGHSADLIERGKQFGDSRRICNVHWRSDVEEGRVIAIATYQKLKLGPGFKADFAAAKAELASVKHQAEPADCAAERRMLRAGMM